MQIKMKYLSCISLLYSFNFGASSPTTTSETESRHLVDEVQYVTSKLYKKFCPLGYAAITDLDTCESAAKVLGINYVPSKNGHTYYKYDAVCFATYIDYNTKQVSQWSTAQVNSNHYHEDAYICEVRHEASPKYIKQIMALDSCPEGYSEITSESVCDEAAGFLGYDYDAAKNGNSYSSNERVCYVSYLEWYAEKTTEWSKVQVNSDHYKDAAYICESTEASSTSLNSPTSAPDSFMIQKRNVDSCPEGFSEITNTETCLTAAESLGVEYNQSYNGNGDYGEPVVCFATYIDNFGNANKLLLKSVARINSNHYAFGGWLCKKND